MENKANLIKILNAFRMGVIPDVVVDFFTVGREAQLKEMDQFLFRIKRETCSSVKFLRGGYGTGKTFFLKNIKQRAIEEGFIVSEVSIDSAFNLSKIDLFYTNLMSHLSMTNDHGHHGTSFEAIFDHWILKLKEGHNKEEASEIIYQVINQLNDYNNAFANVLLIYMRAKINNDDELANIAASWIKGDRNISYELKKRLKVKGSVDKENAVEIFRSFVKLMVLIGYSGILITIDEAEIIMNQRSDIRQKAYSHIRYFMDACGSNEIEQCGIVFAGTDELFENDEKGFPSYDALNQRIGQTINKGQRSVTNVRQSVMLLDSFSQEDYYMLTKKILKIYEDYYNDKIDMEISNIYNLVMIECVKGNGRKEIVIRSYIKKLLEILDLAMEQPDLPLFNTKVIRIQKR